MGVGCFGGREVPIDGGGPRTDSVRRAWQGLETGELAGRRKKLKPIPQLFSCTWFVLFTTPFYLEIHTSIRFAIHPDPEHIPARIPGS